MRILQVHAALVASAVAEHGGGDGADPAAHRGHPAPQRQGRLREPRRHQLAHRRKERDLTVDFI